jgi:hypothetical protein
LHGAERRKVVHYGNIPVELENGVNQNRLLLRMEVIVGGGGCMSCSAKEEPVGVVYVGKLGNYRSKGRKASYLAQRDVGRSPIRSAYNAIKYGPALGEKLSSEYDIHQNQRRLIHPGIIIKE